MIQTIKDYLLTVLVRAIIGYIFFVLILIVIFIAYIIIVDLTSAIKFFTEFAKDDFGKVVVFMPLFSSFFKADKEGSADLKVKKKDTIDEYLITGDSKWL